MFCNVAEFLGNINQTKKKMQQQEPTATTTTILQGAVQNKISCLFKTQAIITNPKYNAVSIVATKELKEAEMNADDWVATEKVDGTCCLVRNGKLWKRFDKKLNKIGDKKRKQHVKLLAQWQQQNNDQGASSTAPVISYDQATDFKEAPATWVAADDAPEPNEQGHHVGWCLVDAQQPGDKWHASCLAGDSHALVLVQVAENDLRIITTPLTELENCTCELIGPKVNANPYAFTANAKHILVKHGSIRFFKPVPMTFDTLKHWFETEQDGAVEGVVWWKKSGGKMYKVHRNHVNLDWPLPSTRWSYGNIKQA